MKARYRYRSENILFHFKLIFPQSSLVVKKIKLGLRESSQSSSLRDHVPNELVCNLLDKQIQSNSRNQFVNIMFNWSAIQECRIKVRWLTAQKKKIRIYSKWQPVGRSLANFFTQGYSHSICINLSLFLSPIFLHSFVKSSDIFYSYTHQSIWFINLIPIRDFIL